MRIAEAWHGEEFDVQGSGGPARADILRRFQREEPAPGALSREFHTILIDLARDESALFDAMREGCRYKVRRAAERDALIYDSANANERSDLLARFAQLYEDFARRKQLPAPTRGWLSLMASTGNLYVSRVSDKSDRELTWHTHYFSGGRATLLHSAPTTHAERAAGRSPTGRANRLHHWRDILYFKRLGAKLYDLGGWYSGDADARRLGINRFKEEFGGHVVKNFIDERALTLRGKLFLRARQSLLGDAI